MRPRPLYRWKSFWFGLLVLAFMGWASWDSLRFYSRLRVPTSTRTFAVGRINRATFFVREDRPHPKIELERFKEPDPERRFRDMRSWSRIPIVSIWWVPDAAVFFPFLLAWVALLGWRWRRQNKAKESS